MSRIEDEPPLDIIDYLTIFFIVLVFAFSIYLVVDKLTPEKYEYQPREESVVRQTNIHYYPQFTVLASLAHLYPKDMRDTLTCESNWIGGKWGDLDLQYPVYGIAQFQNRTFNWMKKEAGWDWMEWKNDEHQLQLMEWAFEQGYQEHWSCWKVLTRN